ncbi:MAG: hypothetical protein ACK559_02545, partial [bacterium]
MPHGHAGGDAPAYTVGAVRVRVHDEDLAARVGGEEPLPERAVAAAHLDGAEAGTREERRERGAVGGVHAAR